MMLYDVSRIVLQLQPIRITNFRRAPSQILRRTCRNGRRNAVDMTFRTLYTAIGAVRMVLTALLAPAAFDVDRSW